MKVFAVYPAMPEMIGKTIDSAQKLAKFSGTDVSLWPQLDIAGRFIVDGVLGEIDECDFLLADITVLNFNVLFEIGYAIGKQKRVILTLDESLNPPKKEIASLGILDTIGYKVYQNSQELGNVIIEITSQRGLHFAPSAIDRGAPIYVVDTLFKTDASVHILSKIKKSGFRFRIFDPQEQSRMSTLEAYKNVEQSVAIVISLLRSNQTDCWKNNLRGAFVAGLSYGRDREVLLLQEGEEPVPLDYRDLVCTYKHPEDIDKYLNDLAPKVVEALQAASEESVRVPEKMLEKLDLGSPAAENEVMQLQHYYMKTDEYNQVLKVGARLAAGRKGSGKTALFFQIRDRLRKNQDGFVLALKPEGHQLKRFKHLVLRLLNEAVREHVASAFWEYVLYLELCYKILDKDRELHVRRQELFEPYQKLAALYSADIFIEEADFSERMLKLINRISEKFHDRFGEAEGKYITAGEVTSFVYQHDLPTLRKEIVQYLEHKKAVYILFDNIDKGWPTRGIEEIDILLVRSLLDATRKVERALQRRQVEIHTTVFLRSDVYELLVEGTPDRGKESRVSLDWTDSALMHEFLRRRIVYNNMDHDTPFSSAWNSICLSHIEGSDSAEFLINASLMRPRNLVNLVNQCKSSAVNLRHARIEEEDIWKGLAIYSSDVSNEIGLEIRDICPEAEDVIYCFIGAPARLTLVEVKRRISDLGISEPKLKQVVEILLWYGFLGVIVLQDGAHSECYIYDVHYDIKKLKKLARDMKEDNIALCIHCAFWQFLEIKE